MPYVFGVDGGASNSRSIFITDAGRVVFTGKGPGVNYHEVGASNVSATISRLYQDALKAARARTDECLGVCLGLAGVGRRQDHEMLSPLFDECFGKERYVLLSDAEVALTGGAISESGIIIIAGTGSMAYGRNDKQQTGRIGGYGPLLSDEGSGYRIALKALQAIARCNDGFPAPTSLTEAVFAHLKIKSFDEMVSWIYSPAAGRERIAALAPLVMRAASEDDPIADEILNQEADALALRVELLSKRLELPERVDVVLSGGLFSQAANYSLIVKRKICYLLPGANVIPPKLEPVIGAALYALSLAGIALDEDMLDTIKRTYQEALQAKPVTDEPPIDEALSASENQ
ncbi:MAG: BadF/BadG/BcrA/BcrD ATPase family protein [Candidatus Omnitrophota bacterium]